MPQADHNEALSRTLEGRQLVEARDERHRLLLRFDPVSKTATIYFHEAELQVRSVGACIEISSQKAIRIRSAETIEIAGQQGVSLIGVDSRLAVNPESVDCTTNSFRANVSRLDFVGSTLTARADDVKLTWGRCERIVGRAFEYARHAYHRVEVLLHTRAGRIRTEAVGAHLMRAGTTRIQATEDVRIQGQSINLG
jgi:hypothetical protein